MSDAIFVVGALARDGAPSPMTDAERNLLESLFPDPVLRAALEQSGLYRCYLFGNTNNFLRVLGEGYGVRQCSELFFSYGSFSAVVNDLNATISNADVLAFLADSTVGVNVTPRIVYAANVTDGQKNRLAGRLMSLLQAVAPTARVQSGAQGTPVDDAVMTIAVQTQNCKEWKISYGDPIQLRQIAPPTVLGKISHGFSTRILHVVSLNKFVPQDVMPSQSSAMMVADKKTGQLTYKFQDKRQHIRTTDDFLSLISVMAFSFAFVGITVQAPVADWSGGPEVGIVRGTRRMFSRAGAEYIIQFWTDVVRRYVRDVGKLVELEEESRKAWMQPFADGKQLESIVRDELKDFLATIRMSGECLKAKRAHSELLTQTQSRLSNKQQRIPHNPNSKINANPNGGAGSSKLDMAKKAPGFTPGRPTAAKTEGGDLICKFYADGRGCAYGANCNKKHVCDVIVNGKACGQEHTRAEHK